MVQEGEVALNAVYLTDTDSINTADSLASESEPLYGLLLTPPEPPTPAPLRNNGNMGVSFILLGLFILFLIIALRFRNNIKYAVTMFRNLVETRTRQNVFDDTVRETSLIVLLNIMWCACAGIIGFCIYVFYNPMAGKYDYASVGMLVGMGLAILYTFVMWCAYSVVGWIFSDRAHAVLWTKGFTASQALMAPALLLISLLGICQPSTALLVGIMGACVFICGKMIFIWKGYKIFFNQISSWVLFLCYLCSLEIVPLILCYRSALLLGEVL